MPTRLGPGTLKFSYKSCEQEDLRLRLNVSALRASQVVLHCLFSRLIPLRRVSSLGTKHKPSCNYTSRPWVHMQ
jgi:hypothetical protein